MTQVQATDHLFKGWKFNNPDHLLSTGQIKVKFEFSLFTGFIPFSVSSKFEHSQKSVTQAFSPESFQTSASSFASSPCFVTAILIAQTKLGSKSSSSSSLYSASNPIQFYHNAIYPQVLLLPADCFTKLILMNKIPTYVHRHFQNLN